MTRKILLTILLLLTGNVLFGQMFPERRGVRRGNRAYEKGDHVRAEADYMGALSKNPASYEGNFNLGDALYRQGRFEEAEQRFQQLGQTPWQPEGMAKTQYNLGNSQVSQYQGNYNKEKLKLALESYKQSLRLDPNDREAKFNLAYVQKLLENEQGGGGGGGDNNQDQEQNQDQNNQDQNNDQDQDQDQNQDQQNDDQNQGRQPPPEGRMSREEAEQLLNALQNSEDRTREKAEKEQAAGVQRSGRNW